MRSDSAQDRARLTRAYEATSYRAWCPDGEIVIRIGRHCGVLDSLLSRSGVSSWAFISAANPGSVRRDPDENAVRHAELLSVLDRTGLTGLVGVGEPDDPSWPAEPSVLVLGVESADAIVLARRFGQNAIVFGCVGESARLIWC